MNGRAIVVLMVRETLSFEFQPTHPLGVHEVPITLTQARINFLQTNANNSRDIVRSQFKTRLECFPFNSRGLFDLC